MFWRPIRIWQCLILALSAAFAVYPALAEEQSKLPAGYYIFMGKQPGSSPPKSVIIKDDGSVHWQDLAKSGSSAANHASEAAPAVSAKSTPAVESHSQAQWESYNYPMIKWKAHPITTIPGGIAQLTTRFDPAGGSYSEGCIKYRLTLFKVPETPYAVQVQLVDANGFKVLEFQVYQSSFHPVPGTALLEASEECSCTEKEYKQARDYTVK